MVKSLHELEAYLEFCHKTNIKLFAKIVNDFQPLNIFKKISKMFDSVMNMPSCSHIQLVISVCYSTWVVNNNISYGHLYSLLGDKKTNSNSNSNSNLN